MATQAQIDAKVEEIKVKELEIQFLNNVMVAERASVCADAAHDVARVDIADKQLVVDAAHQALDTATQALQDTCKTTADTNNAASIASRQTKGGELNTLKTELQVLLDS